MGRVRVATTQETRRYGGFHRGLGMGQGMGRRASGGGGGTPAQGPALHTLVTGATVTHSWRGANVTQSGGFASQISDIVGSQHIAQAGADSTKGLYDAAGGPNGRPIVSGGTGSGNLARIMQNTFDPGTPATANIYRFSIVRLNSWSAGAVIFSNAVTGDIALACSGSSPNVVCRNNALSTAIAMTIGTWFIVEEFYDGGTGGYFRVGTTEHSGLTLGNSNPAANMGLFARPAPANFCDVSWAESFVIVGGQPSNRLAVRTAAQASDQYQGVVG